MVKLVDTADLKSAASEQGRAGIEPARPCSEAADFKSAGSTNFTIGALHRSVTGQRELLTPATAAPTKKGSVTASLFSELERENGFEPSTSTLARLRSTN